VRVATQILGNDSKRLHLAREMFNLASEERAATRELMYLHIDLGACRVVRGCPRRMSAFLRRPRRIPGSRDPAGPDAASQCRPSCKDIERRGE
jgi:hypothetical protein